MPADLMPSDQIVREARASLLRMAKEWETGGQIHQAMDAYSRILATYPDTDEAREVSVRMLQLAQSFERQGCSYLALSLYRRLGEPG